MDIDEFRQQFGHKIQHLRRQRKLSQEQMAEAIERSTDAVSNIERGIGFPRLDTAFRIASVLEVPFIELFDIGTPRPTNRVRRQKIEEIVELLSQEDEDMLEAILSQVKISLHIKKLTASKAPRSKG